MVRHCTIDGVSYVCMYLHSLCPCVFIHLFILLITLSQGTSCISTFRYPFCFDAPLSLGFSWFRHCTSFCVIILMFKNSPVPSILGCHCSYVLCQPSNLHFSFMVRHHVVFGLPCFLLPSGVQVNAVFAGRSLIILKTCPSRFHLLLLRMMQLFLCFVVWLSLVLKMVSDQYIVCHCHIVLKLFCLCICHFTNIYYDMSVSDVISHY